MGQSGRSCRKVDRRGKLAGEPFDVQVAPGKVRITFRGRVVRTLTGTDADAIRDAIASRDDAAVQLVLARKTGNFQRGKRGNER
ncbi:MAG: hypothetical protein H0T42_15140 [Deltaproteobacteria bacterium]|nr:hypothetical protein [Deltaproteobacteria bacterium]